MKTKPRDFLFLTILYTISLLLYAYIAKDMTLPTYRWVDEDLHISLAKSFHFYHSFRRNNQYVGEYSILYSIFLSAAYYFYTPENIVTIMRIMSLAIMCTVVYPVFLLACRVLNRKPLIWCITIFSVFIPEMFLGMYLLQETLAYPLMLWTIYLIYRRFARDKWSPKDLIIPVFLAVIFFVKTCLIVLSLCYYATEFVLLFRNIRHKKAPQPHVLRNICVSALSLACLILLSQIFIQASNNFQSVDSHYVAQVSRIFPIRANSVKRIVEGCAFYVVYILLEWGMLPILVPVSCVKKMEKRDFCLLVFLISAISLTILEIVITIVLPEESLDSPITNVHSRYFFYYFLPLFMLFLKYQRTCKLNWKMSLGIFLFVCTGAYFMCQNDLVQPFFISSNIWFWLRAAVSEIAGGSMLLLFGEAALCVIYLIWKNPQKIYYHFLSLCLIASILFVCNQNYIRETGGYNRNIQEEIIQIVGDTKQIENIYLATDTLTNPVIALGDYTNKDFRVMPLSYGCTHTVYDNFAIVIPNDLLAEYQLGQGDVDVAAYNLFSVLYDGGDMKTNESNTAWVISTKAAQ